MINDTTPKISLSKSYHPQCLLNLQGGCIVSNLSKVSRPRFPQICRWSRETGGKATYCIIVAPQPSPLLHFDPLWRSGCEPVFGADQDKHVSLSGVLDQHLHKSSPEPWGDGEGSGRVWVTCRGLRYHSLASRLLLMFQCMCVTDMTEPVALALGSFQALPGRCVRFSQC